MLVLTGEQARLCNLTREAVMRALMELFGARWAQDPSMSAEPAEVDRFRDELALPIAMGAHIALADFLWATAPPDAEAWQAVRTICVNTPDAVSAAVEVCPSGSFWTHAREQLAKGPK